MHIVIIAFVTALGYYILLLKFLGVANLLRFEKWLDAIFSLGIPLLFLGTFSGMATAALAGLFLSMMIAALRWLVGGRV